MEYSGCVSQAAMGPPDSESRRRFYRILAAEPASSMPRGKKVQPAAGAVMSGVRPGHAEIAWGCACSLMKDDGKFMEGP